MAILVDTNILLRSVQPHHPHYVVVERAFAKLRSGSEPLVVSVQNLFEFWSVATRPAERENGLGLSPELAAREMAAIKDLFPMLPEGVPLLDQWEQLVTTHRVSGKNSHDARLVAAMQVHVIKQILTFNVSDFARYPDIRALEHKEAP